MDTVAIRRASPSDAAGIAQVRVASWRTTYAGIIPDAYLAAMKIEDSTALWTRVLSANSAAVSVFVAEHDGSVVGFAAGNMLAPPKYELNAELTAIYLNSEFQRSGTGTRLVAAVAEAQRSQGATGLLTWVIAANKRARTFYERLGASLLVEQPFQWDGMDLVEAGYGWSDLDALTKISSPSETSH